MTKDEIKNRLKDILELNGQINRMIDQLSDLKIDNPFLRSAYSMGDRVQSSRDPSVLETWYVGIDEMERKIDDSIDRLIDMKEELRPLVDSIPNEKERLLMEMRCFQCRSWKEISHELGISPRHCNRVFLKLIDV